MIDLNAKAVALKNNHHIRTGIEEDLLIFEQFLPVLSIRHIFTRVIHCPSLVRYGIPLNIFVRTIFAAEPIYQGNDISVFSITKSILCCLNISLMYKRV